MAEFVTYYKFSIYRLASNIIFYNYFPAKMSFCYQAYPECLFYLLMLLYHARWACFHFYKAIHVIVLYAKLGQCSILYCSISITKIILF